MHPTRALVWFKRDLRLRDHAALGAAQACDDAAGVFIVEPQWLQSPECDPMHVQFALACLAELRAVLAQRGVPLLVRVGPAVEVLAQLPAYPMVDACMRSLVATGWLNFRMRAMLVSFASYHLWLHWRRPGQFLARQFLDFEPGIHWSQMQMQSGTTGINTLRIYSPTKQAQDHDPQGQFIRRWVPELGRVPLPWLARPWMMDAATQAASGCRIGGDYPHPVVDERSALLAARERLYGLRATPQARAEADAVQARHGSRKSGLPPTRRPRAQTLARASGQAGEQPSLQADLFG